MTTIEEQGVVLLRNRNTKLLGGLLKCSIGGFLKRIVI